MPSNPPKGWPQISISIFYQDVPAALEFLVEAFGFHERLVVRGEDGAVVHSELEFGSGLVMLAGVSKEKGWDSPQNLQGTNTRGLYVFVDDIDTHCERARAAGAQIVEEPTTRDYGDRVYTALDCEGHQWGFGQRVDNESRQTASKEGAS